MPARRLLTLAGEHLSLRLTQLLSRFLRARLPAGYGSFIPANIDSSLSSLFRAKRAHSPSGNTIRLRLERALSTRSDEAISHCWEFRCADSQIEVRLSLTLEGRDHRRGLAEIRSKQSIFSAGRIADALHISSIVSGIRVVTSGRRSLLAPPI
jgi:hypothetical protein